MSSPQVSWDDEQVSQSPGVQWDDEQKPAATALPAGAKPWMTTTDLAKLAPATPALTQQQASSEIAKATALPRSPRSAPQPIGLDIGAPPVGTPPATAARNQEWEVAKGPKLTLPPEGSIQPAPNIPQDTTGTIRAVDPAKQNWFQQAATDVRYGTDVTAPGKVLKTLGAPGIARGSSPTASEFLGGPIIGPIETAEGLGKVFAPTGSGEQSMERVRGFNEAVGGALKTVAPALAANPEFLVGLSKYGVGQAAISKAAQELGADKDTADAIANAVLFYPAAKEAIGKMADLRGSAFESSEGTSGKSVSAFGGKVKGGYVTTPEGETTVGVKVGEREPITRTFGGKAKSAATPIEPTTIKGESGAVSSKIQWDDEPASSYRAGEVPERFKPIAPEKPAERPVVHASSDPAEIRASAEEQHPDFVDSLQKVADQVPGARVVDPGVKTAESLARNEGLEKPAETKADVLRAQIVTPDEATKKQAEQIIASHPATQSVEKIQNDNLPITQAVVGVGKDGEANRAAEVQIATEAEHQAQADTHPIYAEMQNARARGDEAEADKLQKQLDAELAERAASPALAGEATAESLTETPRSLKETLPLKKGSAVTVDNKPGTLTYLSKQGFEKSRVKLDDGKTVEVPHREVAKRIQAAQKVPSGTNVDQMATSGPAVPTSKFANDPHVEMVPISELEKIREYDREASPATGFREPGYLDALTEDMRKNGLQEPLTVVYDPKTKHAVLGSGNHRLAAAKRLGIKELPVKVTTAGTWAMQNGVAVKGHEGELREHLKPSEIGIGGGTTEAVPSSREETAPATGITSGTPDQPKPKSGAIAVDLDKTLAHYEEGDAAKNPTAIGKPLAPMVDKVKQMLADGKEVWVFSARAENAEAVSAIKAWTKEHIGKELPVTNVKYPTFQTFYDDRAEKVEPNQGASAAAAEPVKTPEKPFKYGSTQANIPHGSDASNAIIQARNRISADDLAGQGKDVGGEHVTVRYGIQGSDVSGIREHLASLAPFEASLGKTRFFPPSEHSDGAAVIIAPIEAPELHTINAALEKHGDFTEPSFKEYKPHATIAYVKPEAAPRYTGMGITDGKKFTVSEIAITNREGVQEVVPLKGGANANEQRIGAEHGGAPAPETERTENAIREQGPAGLLQRQPQEAGVPGSGRGRVEPGVQGQDGGQAAARAVEREPQRGGEGDARSPNEKEVAPSETQALRKRLAALEKKVAKPPEKAAPTAKQVRENIQKTAKSRISQTAQAVVAKGSEGLLKGESGEFIPSALKAAAAPLQNIIANDMGRKAEGIQKELAIVGRAENARQIRLGKEIHQAFTEAGFVPEDGDAVRKNIESGAPLTPKQEQLRDEYVNPLREAARDNVTLYRMIESGKYDIEELVNGDVSEEELAKFRPTGDGYLHRIAVNHPSMIDWALGSKLSAWGSRRSVLSKQFSASKRAVFQEARGPNGEREAVAVKGDQVTRFEKGDDGKITTEKLGPYRSGFITTQEMADEVAAPLEKTLAGLKKELGILEGGGKRAAASERRIGSLYYQIDSLERQIAGVRASVSPAAQARSGMTDEEVVAARRRPIERRIAQLEKQKASLEKSTAEPHPLYTKVQEASGRPIDEFRQKRIARIDEQIGDAKDALSAVEDEFNSRANEGRYWRDKNGQLWQFNRGSSDFITERTGQKYHDNAMLSSTVNYLETARAVQAAITVERQKAQLEGEGLAIKTDNPKDAPDGWKRTELQQMRGYYFPSYIADAYNQFAENLSRGEPNALERLNRFNLGVVLMNPLMHGKNVVANWMTGKAAEALSTGRLFSPSAWMRNAKAGIHAVNDVVHVTEDYIKALEGGLDLLRANPRFDGDQKAVLESLAKHFEMNPEDATAWQKALHIPGKVWEFLRHQNHALTFGMNDVATLQAYYAALDRFNAEGLPNPEQAARDFAHNQTMEYRPFVRFAGSRRVEKALEDPILSAFWRYHSNLIRQIGQAAGDASGASFREEEGAGGKNQYGESKNQARARGAAKLAFMALMATMVYPYVLDPLAKKLTGNRKAEAPRGGLLGATSDLKQMIQGEKTPFQVVHSLFTPALATENLAQILANTDFYKASSGRDARIVKSDRDLGTQAGQLGHWMAGRTLPGQMAQTEQFSRGTWPWRLTGMTFPGKKHGRSGRASWSKFGRALRTGK